MREPASCHPLPPGTESRCTPGRSGRPGRSAGRSANLCRPATPADRGPLAGARRRRGGWLCGGSCRARPPPLLAPGSPPRCWPCIHRRGCRAPALGLALPFFVYFVSADSEIRRWRRLVGAYGALVATDVYERSGVEWYPRKTIYYQVKCIVFGERPSPGFGAARVQ